MLTNNIKGLKSFDELFPDILGCLWVVIWRECVLEKLDMEFGGIECLEFGLGYPLVVIQDCDFDNGAHGGSGISGCYLIRDGIMDRKSGC